MIVRPAFGRDEQHPRTDNPARSCGSSRAANPGALALTGGPFARLTACPICGSRAVRTFEGDHDDHYRCDAEHTFQIEWCRFSVPTAPEWPAPAELNTLFGKSRSLGID
jgi:hypothetical protein